MFRTVLDGHPEARLCIVGDGPLRPELEAQAAGLALGDAVRFAGWSDAMPAWHAAADIVVNSSDSEGTPLVLIEAGATGRPVVATRVGGVADVVIDGETGWLVEREDEAGFAERIGRLIDDPAMRDADGRGGRRPEPGPCRGPAGRRGGGALRGPARDPRAPVGLTLASRAVTATASTPATTSDPIRIATRRRSVTPPVSRMIACPRPIGRPSWTSLPSL